MLLRTGFCAWSCSKRGGGARCAAIARTGLCLERGRGSGSSPCSHTTGRRVSLICPFPFSAGGSLGVLIKIHQDSINSTMGQSVLLPVSYGFDGAPHFPVSIAWRFGNNQDALITCTVLNCSLGAGGAPSHCFAKHFPRSTYNSRAELFPENGSLLLRDLQLSDSGVYHVTFRPSYQTQRVTLTVHEQRVSPHHPGECKRECAQHRHLLRCPGHACGKERALAEYLSLLSKGRASAAKRGFPGMSYMVL